MIVCILDTVGIAILLRRFIIRRKRRQMRREIKDMRARLKKLDAEIKGMETEREVREKGST